MSEFVFLWGPVMAIGGVLCFFAGWFAVITLFGGFPRTSVALLGLSAIGLVMVIGGCAWNVVYVPEYLNQTATVAETCTWTNNTTTSILICHR